MDPTVGLSIRPYDGALGEVAVSGGVGRTVEGSSVATLGVRRGLEHLHFQVWGFGFRVWGSGLGFEVSGFGLGVSGMGLRVSSFGFHLRGFAFRAWGLGFGGSGTGLEDS